MDQQPVRCSWANPQDARMLRYHDEEWGVPEHDDHQLFELLLLESFQAGLSWKCVLDKRGAFRAAFDDFDAEAISRYDDAKIDSLMNNPDIIRNRLKIRAAITNAQSFLRIRAEFSSFDAYIWHFTNGQTVREPYDLRTTSPLSDAISADLKKRGMKFVGSTIIYSYLQAIGIINGHISDCFRYRKCIE